jgi:transcriptional regulator with XRE-family HTH domain
MKFTKVNTWQTARLRKGWTQARTAREVNVTQAYVALVESGRRQPSLALQRRLAKALDMPPVGQPVAFPPPLDHDELGSDLANLGHPGFQYMRRLRQATRNPAGVLLSALRETELEPRLAEALPWVVASYPALEWDWLIPLVKTFDLQNKLGFVVTLARQLAERNRSPSVEALRGIEAVLEQSRLMREDTFGQPAISEADKGWLRKNRSREAAHWNVLTSLTVEHLPHTGGPFAGRRVPA